MTLMKYNVRHMCSTVLSKFKTNYFVQKTKLRAFDKTFWISLAGFGR